MTTKTNPGLDELTESATPNDAPEARPAGESKKRILVADDDAAIRRLLVELLISEGYDTVEAKTGTEVLRTVPRAEPDLLVLDLRMPESDGIEIMRRLKEQDQAVPVLLITAHSSASSAIQAMQLGAYDYITKPFDVNDVLLRVRRFFEYQALASEVRKLRGQLEGRDLTDRIVGASAKMLEIYKTIGQVASSDKNVLIMGETGAGKEVVAEVIHLSSPYRNGPLVKVNLTALPETLVESELFGHEKGSFTGAIAQHKGRFEQAHKGTIFLDEIGDMSLNTQRKLLRVLQDKQFERVGGSAPVRVDCRVIAATNKNLQEEVLAGRFREDLYYRLNVITIHVPPLRERKDDIPLLVEHFLNKHRFNSSAPPARISEEAMHMLQEHNWPGNVRQLEHTIERAVVMSRGGVITSEHLALAPVQETAAIVDLNQQLEQGHSLELVLEEVERRLLALALERSSGNRHHAAHLLGIELASLERKLVEHGLSS